MLNGLIAIQAWQSLEGIKLALCLHDLFKDLQGLEMDLQTSTTACLIAQA